MKGKAFKYEEYHQIINDILYKKCTLHEEYFPNENPWLLCTNEYFYTNKKNKSDGLCPECIRCSKIRSLDWQHGNKIKRLEYQKKVRQSDHSKEYAKKHGEDQRQSGYSLNWQRSEAGKESSRKAREKRKLKEHKISKKEWLNCKIYFSNCCAYCGLPIEEHYYTRLGVTKQGDFHKDHADDSGANDLSNCLPACKSCNTSKHTTKLEEWYTSRNQIFSLERLNKINKWLIEDYKIYINNKI